MAILHVHLKSDCYSPLQSSQRIPERMVMISCDAPSILLRLFLFSHPVSRSVSTLPYGVLKGEDDGRKEHTSEGEGISEDISGFILGTVNLPSNAKGDINLACFERNLAYMPPQLPMVCCQPAAADLLRYPAILLKSHQPKARECLILTNMFSQVIPMPTARYIPIPAMIAPASDPPVLCLTPRRMANPTQVTSIMGRATQYRVYKERSAASVTVRAEVSAYIPLVRDDRTNYVADSGNCKIIQSRKPHPARKPYGNRLVL